MCPEVRKAGMKNGEALVLPPHVYDRGCPFSRLVLQASYPVQVGIVTHLLEQEVGNIGTGYLRIETYLQWIAHPVRAFCRFVD